MVEAFCFGPKGMPKISDIEICEFLRAIESGSVVLPPTKTHNYAIQAISVIWPVI